MTYDEYLKTDSWKKVRSARKRIDSSRCVCCGYSKHLEVHHVQYPKSWFDTTTDDLRTLCKDCHKTVHRIIEHIQTRPQCIQDDGRLVYLTHNPMLVSSVKMNIARKIVVICWMRNLYSTREVCNYSNALLEIVNMTGGYNINPPHDTVREILATVKDCYISNKQPTFNADRRKYNVKAKTKYK